MKPIKQSSKLSLVIRDLRVYRFNNYCQQCWMLVLVIFILNFSLNESEEFFEVVLTFSNLRVLSLSVLLTGDDSILNHLCPSHCYRIEESGVFLNIWVVILSHIEPSNNWLFHVLNRPTHSIKVRRIHLIDVRLTIMNWCLMWSISTIFLQLLNWLDRHIFLCVNLSCQISILLTVFNLKRLSRIWLLWALLW